MRLYPLALIAEPTPCTYWTRHHFFTLPAALAEVRDKVADFLATGKTFTMSAQPSTLEPRTRKLWGHEC
jgi:hypothetical protein